MIRKVLLLYPSARRYSGFLSTHRVPGLATSHSGLTILAQILARQGIEARVIDEQTTPFTDELLDGVDLVGVSIQTSWAPQGYRIAAAARRLGVPVVLGGVHATLNPDEAIAHADYVVRGEGEHTLPELVAAIDAGGVGLDRVKGLSWHDRGAVRHNPARPLMTTAELDEVPWPRMELIEGFADARHPIGKFMYFTMLTRGCDQSCTFCSIIRVFGQSLRRRSLGNIIEELGSRYDPQRQFLFLMDDSLAVDTDFLKEFLEALLRERLVPRHGWHSQMRAEVADDPELLSLMRRTNCIFVTCGFESIDPKSLKSLAKGQSPDDIRRAVTRLREHGIIVNGFFMFGTDEDGPDSFARTVEFARSSGCMLAGFMPLTPFPGTPTFRQLERDGRIFTKDWELYDVQHVVFRPKRMSPLELYWKTLACYPAFYKADYWARNLRTALERSPSAAVLAVGATWPLVKGLCFARELAANVDYLRALRRMERQNGAAERFPDLGSRRLWAKDLVSGRALAQVMARVA